MNFNKGEADEERFLVILVTAPFLIIQLRKRSLAPVAGQRSSRAPRGKLRMAARVRARDQESLAQWNEAHSRPPPARRYRDRSTREQRQESLRRHLS